MPVPFFYTTRYTLDKSHFSETFDESISAKKSFKPYYKATGLAVFGFVLLRFTELNAYVAWFLMAIAGVEALGVYFKKPWWLARQMISQAANTELTLTINEEGIHSKSFVIESKITWSEINKIERTKQGWLLYQGKRRSYLSNRILSQEAQDYIASFCPNC